jgi:hypothetical protein
MHTRKKSAIPPSDVDFRLLKQWLKEFISHRRNMYIFIKSCEISCHKVCEISVEPKTLNKSVSTFQFWNFSILNSLSFNFHYVACILHLLAYEILYARKVDLLDKQKELDFWQLFRVCHCWFSNVFQWFWASEQGPVLWFFLIGPDF